MKEKVLNGKGLAVLSVFVLMIIAMFAAPVRAGAEETQALVTEYANLWTSTDIAVKVGVPVKWYVTVPEDTEPKGCGATVKIPGLGFGTDTHNKEEGHIVLQKGENFIYEFTPTETGDILFTCWMGSGCHYNYIHVTEDGTYTVPKPADPTEISAVREGDKTIVSFKAPEAPKGSSILGYTVTATAEDGTRKKTTVAESPATLEGLDESKDYTIVVVTKGTSGKSAGENSFVLKASGAETESPADNAATEEPKENGTNSGTDDEHDSGSGDEAGKPADTEKHTDTEANTDSKADNTTESTADDNAKEEVKTNEDTSADSTSAERSDGVEKAGSGSASAAFEGANVVKEEKTESAADNGSASAPQSAAESADPNANPHTGENALPVTGSLALLLFLTVSSATENRRKNTKD